MPYRQCIESMPIKLSINQFKDIFNARPGLIFSAVLKYKGNPFPIQYWKEESSDKAHKYIVMRYPPIGHPNELFEQTWIEYKEQPCYYGGSRFYFHCPDCKKVVMHLYFFPNRAYFKCRHCGHLAYRTENLSKFDRALEKKGKLTSKLIYGHIRPKGMHRKTYKRIMRAIDIADYKVFATKEKWLARRGIYL